MCFNCGCNKNKHQSATTHVNNDFDDILSKFNKQPSAEVVRDQEKKRSFMAPVANNMSKTRVSANDILKPVEKTSKGDIIEETQVDVRKAKTVFERPKEPVSNKPAVSNKGTDFEKIMKKFDKQTSKENASSQGNATSNVENDFESVVRKFDKSASIGAQTHNPAAKIMKMHTLVESREEAKKPEVVIEETVVTKTIPQPEDKEFKAQITNLVENNKQKFIDAERKSLAEPKPVQKTNTTELGNSEVGKSGALGENKDKIIEKYSQMLRDGNAKNGRKDSSSSSDSDCNRRVRNKVKPFKRQVGDSSDDE